MQLVGAISPDQRLADFGFQKRFPPPLLSAYVDCIWTIARPGHSEEPREKILYPDGGIGLVFSFGDRLSLNGRPVSSDLFLDGARLTAARVRAPGNASVLGVRFKPGGAFQLLGIPADEIPLCGDLPDAPEFRDLGHLHETMCEARSTAARFQLLMSWLLKRLARARRRSPLVSHAANKIECSGGQLAVRTLSQLLGVSPRQLERLFGRQVGMSPKHLVRLTRVQRAKEVLKQGCNTSLAEVGYLTGYFDQAHFIRDFASIVGLTPSAYIDARRRWGQQCFLGERQWVEERTRAVSLVAATG